MTSISTGVVAGEETLGSWLRAKAERNGDAPALEIHGTPLSYAGINLLADRLGAGFAGLGLGPGDVVAVMLKTSTTAIGVWLGLVRAGVLEVPVNPALRGASLLHVLGHSRARAVVVDEEYLPALLELTDRLTDLRFVVVNPASDAAPAQPGVGLTATGITTVPLPELPAAGPGWEHRGRAADPCVVMYTSGTSGPPKGVVLSHRACLNLARTIGRSMDYGPSDVLFNAYPLVHGSGRYAGVLTAMEADARLVMDRFSATGFWGLCRAKGITSFTYVGSVVLMLWKQPERADDASNPVRVGRGAGAPTDVLEAFERRFGLRLYEVYGMTEAQTAAENLPTERRLGSCGRATSNFEIAIADAEGALLDPGVRGEIVLRPRRPEVMMQGYFRQPEETLLAFRDLWFHTGDRGWMDEDGYLYFVDRLKDIIRRRGENVSAWEVEQVVNGMPEVEESAAYGVPSDLGEEEVMVAVVGRPGAAVTPGELVAICERQLPAFAVPRYVRTVSALPKTATQRVQKYVLREEGVTGDTWDRSGPAAFSGPSPTS